MEGYVDDLYGERIAGIYDLLYQPDTFEKEPGQMIAFLLELAGRGPALELGVGTGRVALPLAATGVEVHGLDASGAMLDRLRSKPGGDEVVLTHGSFADFDLGLQFASIFMVFNTFWGMRTPESEASCLRAVARHLEPNGTFVMEAFVPDPDRFDHGQRLATRSVALDEVVLEATILDPEDPQRLDSSLIVLREGETPLLFPVTVRYAFVEEIDVLAAEAGLRLRERWADWDREPFGPESRKHVSVWEPA